VASVFGSAGGVAYLPKVGTVGLPAQDSLDTTVAGAYAGGGAGMWYSNATSGAALAGPFETTSFNTLIGSIQYGQSGSTWIISVTYGPGLWGSLSKYNTNTKVLLGH
jgi:hypothetical protein